jgi:hypothetical protein
MSERKVLNKYIAPDFNHTKLVKVRKAMARQDNVRMMLPFSIKCDTCGNYLRIGTKINMRKEKVVNETYLTIAVYRFYMKCVFCYSEMTMKTDPKNNDYVMEIGATRLYESWKDARAAEEILQEIRKNEEEGNTMTFLENKTYDSKREMDILEAIDEIRIMSRKNARVDTEMILEALHKRDHKLDNHELKDYVDRMSEIEQERAVKKVADTSELVNFTKSLIGNKVSRNFNQINLSENKSIELDDLLRKRDSPSSEYLNEKIVSETIDNQSLVKPNTSNKLNHLDIIYEAENEDHESGSTKDPSEVKSKNYKLVDFSEEEEEDENQ